MDIISGGNFSEKVEYKQSNFSFGNMVGFEWKWPASLIGRGSWKFNVWFASNGDMVSKFLQLTGKAKNGQTLVEMHADPQTSPEDKILLEELIQKSLEKDEDIDPTVKYNPGSLKESVFTKSQSVVNEVIKYTDGAFAGKDKDEIQSMQGFWSEVAKKIPKGKESDAQVHYFLKKFINRFEERWFSDNDRSIFLRRLKTAQQEMAKGRAQQAEDILRYTIIWTIIKNSWRWGVPPELVAGLEWFKNFFKNNLDTILKPATVSDTMGMQYIGDADKPYVCGNRAEYVEVSDPSLLVGLSPQERKLKWELRKKFKNPEYVNEELFKLAERLQRDYGISNRFKSYYINKKETSSSSPEFSAPKATGAKIKNPHIVQKVKDILEGKNLGDVNDEDELLLGQEDLDMID